MEGAKNAHQLAIQNLVQCARENGNLFDNNNQLEKEIHELEKKVSFLEKARQRLGEKLGQKRQAIKDFRTKTEEMEKKFFSAKNIIENLCVESFPPCERKAFNDLLNLFSSPEEIDDRQAEILEKEISKRGLRALKTEIIA